MEGLELVLKQMIDLLVGGIGGIAEGIGTGLASLVQNIFLEVGEGGEVVGLSVFGGVVLIMSGVSLAIGLSTLVVHWITSLGSSKGM